MKVTIGEKGRTMLAVGEANVEKNFVLKQWPQVDFQKGKGREFPNYVYVGMGFFDLVLFPFMPIMALGHLVHFYGLYLLVTQGLWSTLICSKYL